MHISFANRKSNKTLKLTFFMLESFTVSHLINQFDKHLLPREIRQWSILLKLIKLNSMSKYMLYQNFLGEIQFADYKL